MEEKGAKKNQEGDREKKNQEGDREKNRGGEEENRRGTARTKTKKNKQGELD
jgi:hypothetical protein